MKEEKKNGIILAFRIFHVLNSISLLSLFVLSKQQWIELIYGLSPHVKILGIQRKQKKMYCNLSWSQILFSRDGCTLEHAHTRILGDVRKYVYVWAEHQSNSNGMQTKLRWFEGAIGIAIQRINRCDPVTNGNRCFNRIDLTTRSKPSQRDVRVLLSWRTQFHPEIHWWCTQELHYYAECRHSKSAFIFTIFFSLFFGHLYNFELGKEVFFSLIF